MFFPRTRIAFPAGAGGTGRQEKKKTTLNIMLTIKQKQEAYARVDEIIQNTHPGHICSEMSLLLF